ncbi:hypothetical protein ACEQPO_04915 [Bacillus sp. SL00103]
MAYVLYTSGTTGHPKVSLSNIVMSLIWYME